MSVTFSVTLNGAAVGIKLAISSHKSNSVTTTPFCRCCKCALFCRRCQYYWTTLPNRLLMSFASILLWDRTLLVV